MESRETESANRYRRREMWALTPQQRLAKAAALYQHAMELLEKSPEAKRAFHARNFCKRRDRPDNAR